MSDAFLVNSPPDREMFGYVIRGCRDSSWLWWTAHLDTIQKRRARFERNDQSCDPSHYRIKRRVTDDMEGEVLREIKIECTNIVNLKLELSSEAWWCVLTLAFDIVT